MIAMIMLRSISLSVLIGTRQQASYEDWRESECGIVRRVFGVARVVAVCVAVVRGRGACGTWRRS